MRFSADLPDEWSVRAQVVFADPVADVAVLSIVPRAGEDIVPASFGRVGDRAAVVPCTTLGFPRFKLREGPAGSALRPAGPYRECHQADGAIPSLSNWRAGTLEILVAPPGQDPDPLRSPWEGMSGAVVWSGERIIGLISEHHRREGLNRLTAVRVDGWYKQLPADRLAQLCELTGLPADVRQLADVIPSPVPTGVTADYTAQVEAFAPGKLLDRNTELAELVAFCAGDEPYQWWQAGPWAGKSALAAWLALHPPAGVTAVSFFITARLAGQSDSAAFSEAVTEQLADIAGETPAVASTPAARDGQRRRLLKQAAAQVRNRGERLLMVVDGLDEDRGAPPSGSSSIAALLPEAPPPGVRILVTSRPLPGLPSDVPGSHPLRFCAVRHLVPSQHAQYLEIEAKRELAEHLQGADSLAGDIIAYLTASGGGLTVRELMELTEASQPQVERRLESAFGRSLSARPDPTAVSGAAEDLYLLAHETLREIAGQRLAYDLPRYRQRIHHWADGYRDQGWPDSTPRYLGRSYARLLAGTDDIARLTAVGADPARHDQMLERTLGDADAQSEIADAQHLHLIQHQPDLVSLLLLANERSRLDSRNRYVPHDLPALWLRLGDTRRGQALAVCIPDDAIRARAQAELAVGFAAAGQLDHAEQAVGQATQAVAKIFHPEAQLQVLRDIGRQLGAARNPPAGRRQTPTATDEHFPEPLIHLAQAISSTGAGDRAERAVGVLVDTSVRNQDSTLSSLSREVAELACELNSAGLLDQANEVADEALRLAATIIAPQERALTLTSMATVYLAHDLVDQAAETLQQARHADAEDLEFPGGAWSDVSTASVSLVQALIAEGRWDDAEQEARSIAILNQRATALAVLAESMTKAGQHTRARKASGDAWQAASALDPQHRAEALAGLARSLAGSGEVRRAKQAVREAEQAAASIIDPWLRAGALAPVAATLTAMGDHIRSERAARGAEQAVSAARPDNYGRRPKTIVAALADAGRFDSAERVAVNVADPAMRSDALVALIRVVGDAGLSDRANRLAGEAEQAAKQSPRGVRGNHLESLARALADAGLFESAERVAVNISNLYTRADALVALVRALADAGRFDSAERIAASIPSPPIDPIRAPATDRRPDALLALVRALADAGRFDSAERIAVTITSPSERTQAQTSLAWALAEAGELARAARSAADAERSAREHASKGWLDGSLIGVAHALCAADLVKSNPLWAEARRGRTEVNIALAKVLASAGQFDSARRVAAKITYPRDRATVLADLIGMLGDAGLRDQAEQVARDAEQAAAEVGEDYWLVRLVPVLAEACDGPSRAGSRRY